ncbi:hypothetical protein QNO09_39000 [Streptomyces sp. 378]|uniref:hypothetical protein n=1 Tax=Streptomyces sp. 378 TaxID=3049412 RepID=UPI0024C3529A|nr:hypothetical protein [Streptomyces sp. 378]MDK1349132.1 hypothetical protein [Streptomyces sp. 378]
MESTSTVQPDRQTTASLAAKLVDWGNTELSDRERAILVDLAWRHTSLHERMRMDQADVLDASEEALVRELETEFRRPE